MVQAPPVRFKLAYATFLYLPYIVMATMLLLGVNSDIFEPEIWPPDKGSTGLTGLLILATVCCFWAFSDTLRANLFNEKHRLGKLTFCFVGATTCYFLTLALGNSNFQILPRLVLSRDTLLVQTLDFCLNHILKITYA